MNTENSPDSTVPGPFFTAKLRNQLQRKLYDLTIKLLDAKDVELAIKGATLLEKMYQADVKPQPATKGRTTAEPMSTDARKAAIKERLGALKTPSKN